MKINRVLLKFRKGLLLPRQLPNIDKIILHHACMNGSIEDVHHLHLSQGWAGIGYNYYIRVDGQVYKGRPLEYIPSHCAKNNASSIGICLEGDFRKVKPTEKQIESLKELVKYLKETFPNIKNVYNHRDLFKTLCPVVDLKKMIQ